MKLTNGYTLDNELSYRTIFGSDDKWRSFTIMPEITKEFGSHWNIMFYVGAIATHQDSAYNTWEIRPGIGIKYHFKATKKLILSILTRCELREQYTEDVNSWKESLRARLRLEQTYLINGESFAKNHLWYTLSDQEVFVALDKELNERYSNQILLRLGMGYKLNSHWRYEGLYAYQLSKNTISSGFVHENGRIFRLRCRYYFN